MQANSQTHRQIEHPHSVGIQNKTVLDQTVDAYKVALNLAAMRVQILTIEVGTGIPTIIIEQPAQGSSLKGVLCEQSTPAGSDTSRFFVSHSQPGCLIKWAVPN